MTRKCDHKDTPTDPIRLLLVDDEKGFTDVLAKRMSKRHIQVEKAFSGTEAIQKLRNKDFDIAVLDLKLGDMDGIDILKIFKKMVPGLKVMMLTGHGSEEAAQQGIAHGAVDYLTKPFDINELVRKIQQACHGGAG